MLSFRQYLLEYLTDEQRSRYSSTKMTDKARSDTDHFFGQNNDIIHGEVSGNHQHDKSEIHKQIEHHLGKEIPHEDYRSGLTTDKYNRPIKIGRVIKDEKLRNDFASDNTRQGAKKGANFKTTTVRGIEVAGQTNSAKTPEHPNGHSWRNISCKNVDTGSNKKYLHDEIKHGTVVHFVHDHNGQEIYRAALQPHHNDKGSVVYAVDSEYGIKHPAFTHSAHEVAKKLSGTDKSGAFYKHDKVYNNSGNKIIIHPNIDHKDLDHMLDHEDHNIRKYAASHPNATKEHLTKALNDKDRDVRKTATRNPNAIKEHLDKALNDEHWNVRYAAANHPNAIKEHLDKALNDKDADVRAAAASHPNAIKEHLDKALNDKHWKVRVAAASHPNATKEHLDKALNDEHADIRETAASHSNATKEHLDKALNDKDADVRVAAARHSNAIKEHLDKALNDKHWNVRIAAARHPNATKEHLDKALNDEHADIREAAKEQLAKRNQ